MQPLKKKKNVHYWFTATLSYIFYILIYVSVELCICLTKNTQRERKKEEKKRSEVIGLHVTEVQKNNNKKMSKSKYPQTLSQFLMDTTAPSGPFHTCALHRLMLDNGRSSFFLPCLPPASAGKGSSENGSRTDCTAALITMYSAPRHVSIPSQICGRNSGWVWWEPVSYTHLTLPTTWTV